MVQGMSTSLHQDPQPDHHPTSTSALQKAKRTLKRVRFDGSPEPHEKNSRQQQKGANAPNAPDTTNIPTFTMLDLKATDSVCCHLLRTCSGKSTCKDTCLGYLEYENPQSFKLIFYNASKTTKNSNLNHNIATSSVTTLLQRLQTLHQLTLAHDLAVATLQYHATSWLPQDWVLADIAYFNNSTPTTINDISKDLSSLHLSTQFSTQSALAPRRTNATPEDLKYMYGIRNITLAKLGVALLEIGLQSDMESLIHDPTPHDVISARKVLLAGMPSRATLGSRYFKIAQKCIDCDFSCGSDLGEDSLQSAVYTDVVCALEDMIRDWKRFLGLKGT